MEERILQELREIKTMVEAMDSRIGALESRVEDGFKNVEQEFAAVRQEMSDGFDSTKREMFKGFNSIWEELDEISRCQNGIFEHIVEQTERETELGMHLFAAGKALIPKEYLKKKRQGVRCRDHI